MINDAVGILSSSGGGEVPVVDVLVVDVLHDDLLEDVKVGGELALRAGVDNLGKLVGTGCRLDIDVELDCSQAIFH